MLMMGGYRFGRIWSYGDWSAALDATELQATLLLRNLLAFI